MSQLHEDENIVVLGFGDHIFSEDFNESLNLQKLDDGVIFDHFWPGDLDRETVETLQNVSEKGRIELFTNGQGHCVGWKSLFEISWLQSKEGLLKFELAFAELNGDVSSRVGGEESL